MAPTTGPFSLDRRRAEADAGLPAAGQSSNSAWGLSPQRESRIGAQRFELVGSIDAPGQGLRPWTPHNKGTHSSEAIMGSLTEGDGLLNGFEGNDVITGDPFPCLWMACPACLPLLRRVTGYIATRARLLREGIHEN